MYQYCIPGTVSKQRVPEAGVADAGSAASMMMARVILRMVTVLPSTRRLNIKVQIGSKMNQSGLK